MIGRHSNKPKDMAKISLKENTTEILALLSVAGSLAILVLQHFVEVPKGNEQMINILAGAFFGGGSMVLSYYFGQSKKRETIADPNTQITSTTKTEEIK